MGRPPNLSGFQPRASSGRRDLLQEAAQRMENFFEEMMRDRNGHAETAALTALAGSLGALPGRKSVVLFSEGLAVPAAAAAKFRGAIDAANRSNVSIYAMDAKGLRVHSEQAVTARNLLAIRGVGDDDPAKAADDDTRKSLTSDLERAEFVLKKDPEASLGTLAKETGGFLINNTNDLTSAFARIDAERRFHYLLTYTSTNTATDGTWRRIAVKVKRRGADVRARSGYIGRAGPGRGADAALRVERAVGAGRDTAADADPAARGQLPVPGGRRHHAASRSTCRRQAAASPTSSTTTRRPGRRTSRSSPASSTRRARPSARAASRTG